MSFSKNGLDFLTTCFQKCLIKVEVQPFRISRKNFSTRIWDHQSCPGLAAFRLVHDRSSLIFLFTLHLSPQRQLVGQRPPMCEVQLRPSPENKIGACFFNKRKARDIQKEKQQLLKFNQWRGQQYDSLIFS